MVYFAVPYMAHIAKLERTRVQYMAHIAKLERTRVQYMANIAKLERTLCTIYLAHIAV